MNRGLHNAEVVFKLNGPRDKFGRILKVERIQKASKFGIFK